MSIESCPQCGQPLSSRSCPKCRLLTPSELLLLNAQSGSFFDSVSKGTALTVLLAGFVANELAGAMSFVVTTRKYPYWTNRIGDVVGAIRFVVGNRKMPYWHALLVSAGQQGRWLWPAKTLESQITPVVYHIFGKILGYLRIRFRVWED